MFSNHAYNTAYQCGTYKAIAEMMRDAIRDMDSKDAFEADYAKTRLRMLADQLEEAEEKFQKEVDTATA